MVCMMCVCLYVNVCSEVPELLSPWVSGYAFFSASDFSLHLGTQRHGLFHCPQMNDLKVCLFVSFGQLAFPGLRFDIEKCRSARPTGMSFTEVRGLYYWENLEQWFKMTFSSEVSKK